MNLTPDIIAAGCGATPLRAAQWAAPMQAACARYQIAEPLDVAAFLATYGVESARLTALSENLNYSAAGLLATFPKYFNAAQAQTYANKPEMIANRAYANRNGNGDETSGDGWTFRGRSMGITGRRNYLLCGVGIDLDLVEQPELLEQPANAVMAAAWYWFNRDLSELGTAGNFLGVSRAVNLGSATSKATPNGYTERLALYDAAKKALGVV
ncbi:glycoside hydrolase family 19 protein [Paraburkholderia sp. D15]|uniref:glycoside hydrolase family 19 protein n=1 Tax=Paraburkholderia sp. D15 TaxID=2880218 RepID=UPI0024791A9A|nr:glycoside hydrolase family 19 protein [Paraburkholderia sp. D15]WGS52659.1 glycoside hydrolase family 19 protein [Paraburkholderia sp. D15]